MGTVYIQKEGLTHVNLVNNTGAALVQYQFTVINGLCLVADEAIDNNALGSFHIADNLIAQISEFVATEDTFATADASVYWDPVSGNFSDTAQEGYYKVGTVKTVKDSAGAVEALLRQEAILALGVVPAGMIGHIQYEIAADGSSGLTKNFGFNFQVLDVVVECRATVASGTVTVRNSTPADISDAIVCAVDTTIGRAGTIDDDNSVVSDGILVFATANSGDRALVTLLVKGV